MLHPVGSTMSHRMRGGTLLGFLVGLVFGLSLAVIVAVVVTRAPVPFMHKTNRPSDRLLEPKSQAEAPDPNAPLRSKARPAEGAPAAPVAPAAPPVAMAPASAPPAAPAAPASPGEPKADATSYLLQAGAFRSSSEAEGMKAKLALIGFEARVVDAEVNGQTMYRVRIGPYAQLDAMNRARARLAENGIEASVVRQR